VTVDDWLKEELRDEGFRLRWHGRKVAYKIARELIRLRKRQGLSQTGVARRAGLKQPAIARLESGAVRPTLDTIRRVAQALGRQLEVSLVPATARKKLADTRRPADGTALGAPR
jgi:transcriptional regulator with XRE-family HTH domain